MFLKHNEFAPREAEVLWPVCLTQSHRTRPVGLRGVARDSGLYVALLGDFLLQVVVDAPDLVRPRFRTPLELALTSLLGPVDLETLGYSDH